MAGTTIAQTDQDIQRDVQLELNWDARVSPNEIGVAVKDGVVTLSGTVYSYLKKWSAERAALRVRGVKAVVNEIQVRLEDDYQLSDASIAEAAARALELDSLVPDGAVKASVSGGWVTLRGEVDWDYERTEPSEWSGTSSVLRGSPTSSPSGRVPVRHPTRSRRPSRGRWSAAPRRTPSGSPSTPRAAR
jgi:osmotically-inducible protein OsmY